MKGYSDFKDKIDAIESTPITSVLKSTQLYYMSVFMQYKEEPIIDNQIAVITELTQKMNTNTIALFSSEEERDELKDIVQQIGDSVEKQLKSNDITVVELNITPELSYTIELLNVMAVATKGKNAITEVMCQSLLQGPDFVK